MSVVSPNLRQRGSTLIEVLVALSVLAMISLLTYGAFDSLNKTKAGLERIHGRYHEARVTMARVSRDMQSAYLSAHKPHLRGSVLPAWETHFIGVSSSPVDRVDFVAFTHRRLKKNAHESDQNEIGYRSGRSPKGEVLQLWRRRDIRLDMYPDKGGVYEVLVSDLDMFRLRYLDALTGRWTERWDTRSTPVGLQSRLPLQVEIELVLNEGVRKTSGGPREPLKMVTKVRPQIPEILRFAQ